MNDQGLNENCFSCSVQLYRNPTSADLDVVLSGVEMNRLMDGNDGKKYLNVGRNCAVASHI